MSYKKAMLIAADELTGGEQAAKHLPRSQFSQHITIGALREVREYSYIDAQGAGYTPMFATARQYSEWNATSRFGVSRLPIRGKRIFAVEQRWTGKRWVRTGQFTIIEEIVFTKGVL